MKEASDTAIRFLVPAVMLSFALALSASARQGTPAGAALGSALKRFEDAVGAYQHLHQEAEAKTGPLPKSADPKAITSHQLALGEAIIQARPNARQGDLFTPQVAGLFRRLIAADLARRRPVDRQAFLVSIPDTRVRVNAFYPASFPLVTVPPRLLEALPRLPDGLEYRFAGGALILRDVDPNLVVDVLPGVLPAPARR